MKKLTRSTSLFLSTVLTATLIFLSGCTSVPRPPVYLVDAYVTSVDRAPEVCRYQRKKGSGKTLLGALIGGAIGTQIGKGNGRKLAVVTGTVLGAVAANPRSDPRDGSKLTCKRDGYIAKVTYMHPITHVKSYGSYPLKSHTKAKWINIPVN
jgi:hypothetical protein